MSSTENMSVVGELAATPRFLTDALRSVSSDRWDMRLGGIEFSLRQQCCHLRDVELEGYLVRIFRITAEICPLLVDLDGTRLANERLYHAQDAALAVADFVSLRAMTIAKLRGLPPSAWGREGRFEADSVFDLRELVAMMQSHDKEHCDEISALIAAAAED